MCGGKTTPLQKLVTVATMGAAAPFIAQNNIQKRIEKGQADAMNAQASRDETSRQAAEKIGPQARKFDEVDQLSIDEQKRKRMSLQNGIMGTIKSPLTGGLVAPAAPTEMKKATLGI